MCYATEESSPKRFQPFLGMYSATIMQFTAYALPIKCVYSAAPPLQFIAYAIPTKGEPLEKLDRRMTAELEALADKGPSQAELARYKKASSSVGLAPVAVLGMKPGVT